MFREFYRPKSVEEAVKLRASVPDSIYLGGGSLLNTLTFAKAVPVGAQPKAAIYLADLPIKSITASEEALTIGGGTVIQDLLESELVPPVLKAAANQFSNRNIRCQATVGGNIALKDSSCNMAAMLLALGAAVHLQTLQGQICVPLEEYLATAMPTALITGVSVPSSRLQASWATRRYMRTENDISIFLCDVVLEGRADKLKNVRIVVGGAGPTATRLKSIESQLEGKSLPDRDSLVAAVAPLLSVIGDFRGSVAFKRLVGSEMTAWTINKAVAGLSEKVKVEA